MLFLKLSPVGRVAEVPNGGVQKEGHTCNCRSTGFVVL